VPNAPGVVLGAAVLDGQRLRSHRVSGPHRSIDSKAAPSAAHRSALLASASASVELALAAVAAHASDAAAVPKSEAV
jgi:hypothetical protein